MNNQIEPRHPVPPAPVHPMAALVTVVLDNIFGVVELVDPLAIVLTSVSVGILGAVSTSFIQRYLAKDEWGPAIAKGLVMGIIAGVPFSVAGTAVGVPLLAWAGLHEWLILPGKKDTPTTDDHEIVDGDFKEIK
jgi:hypothetical protein